MYSLLEVIILKIKGENFKFDRNIPFGYIMSLVFRKIISLVVGTIKMRRIGRFFIHPGVVVRCRSKIITKGTITVDKGCYIDALSMEGFVFGNNVSIGKNTTIEGSGTLKSLGVGLVVGDNVGLGTHGFFGCAGGVRIGDDTIFGNYVSIHSENHVFQSHEQLIRKQGVHRKGIVIGRNCWIGAKCTILDGVEIGDGCVVAAGALVNKSFPANSIIGGVPAKLIKSR